MILCPRDPSQHLPLSLHFTVKREGYVFSKISIFHKKSRWAFDFIRKPNGKL